MERQQRGTDPFRWLVEHPLVTDAVVFGLVGQVAIFSLMLLLGVTSERHAIFYVLYNCLMVACAIPLRKYPVQATLVIALLALIHLLWDSLIPGDAMIFYALYCAIVYGSERFGRFAVKLAIFGMLIQVVVSMSRVARFYSYELPLIANPGSVRVVSVLVFGSLLIFATWAYAKFQRAKRSQLVLAEERAKQAERERSQSAELAVAAERSRIAREMHDVVAHSLSVIIAQADGGIYAAAYKPEKATQALQTIADTGREALSDMRGLLGVLRQNEETSYGPQPGLETLPELIERVRAAGVPTQLRLQGDPAMVPQALALSAFRVCQEALTNVMKHAGEGASALVEVDIAADTLTIIVTDDGQGYDPHSDGRGHGLNGVRERLSAYGGTLETGPLPRGGFRVRALFPLQQGEH
ncbi:sensor histidine kinase [Dermabacteraceae bacterium P7006]